MHAPPARRAWIALYLHALGPHASVDVLNQAFVDSFTEATGAAFDFMPYGAHRCRTLGSDLARLERDGVLRRFRLSLPLAGLGFPTWCYCYRLRTE